MRKTLIYIILFMIVLPSCSKRSGSTVAVVKPKYHHRWFDRKKDKKTKRTKVVRMRN